MGNALGIASHRMIESPTKRDFAMESSFFIDCNGVAATQCRLASVYGRTIEISNYRSERLTTENFTLQTKIKLTSKIPIPQMEMEMRRNDLDTERDERGKLREAH